MRPSLASLLALLLLAGAASTTARAGDKQLWLIGGGEPVCSSIEPQYCIAEKREAAETFFREREALRGKQFRYSAAGRGVIAGFDAWASGLSRREALLAELDRRRPQIEGKTLDAASWHALFEPLQLRGEEQDLVDDIFQARVLRRDGGSQKALVFLDGSAPYVGELFRAFVASAAASARAQGHAGPPRIVFLTASSINALDDVDYYGSLLQQAGARAEWLPLEPAFIRARDCRGIDALRFRWNGVVAREANHPEAAALQRELCRHPARLRQMVDGADAFFINGGDQSLTLRSLQLSPGRFTPLAQRLVDRIRAGIPLAGTSAGTAVQSGDRAGAIPMISDGSTSHGLRHGALAAEINSQSCAVVHSCTLDADPEQLVYRASGGLRVFSIGVADTHFHERAREGRLLRLLLDTGTRFGFGVDEATALRADFHGEADADLQVMGAGGVWIVDTKGATAATDARNWSAEGFNTTRLLQGDRARLRDGELAVELQCAAGEHLAPGQLGDDEAYAAVDGRRWTRASAAPVRACKRADGRWRYERLPLRLTQALQAPAG